MIYIIYRHDFDNMENHYPEIKTELGYCSTEESTQSFIAKETNHWPKYQGWDKKMYPNFTYKVLLKID